MKIAEEIWQVTYKDRDKISRTKRFNKLAEAKSFAKMLHTHVLGFDIIISHYILDSTQEFDG